MNSPTPEEREKARQTIRLLYILMAVFILLPFVLWFLTR